MQTGSVADRLRSGKPRIGPPRDDKVLIRINIKDPHTTSPELAKEWSESIRTTASTSLIRRRLLSCGLCGRKARGSLYQPKSSKKARYGGPGSMVVRQ